ncbi:unnamed protein product [Brassicogethes aeneus]|uniref:AN1-type domain-containing protein n=1 Tax=Brassicogethes aeneus TaxID=1431903 RepID=A0A9P0AXN4_BRAAE|nr:unnamed protein product [Brassicogethes aeneus]
MELPQIGKQCHKPNCKQLDFLPLQCKCLKLFCSEHFNDHVRLCEKSRYLNESELKKITEVYKCTHLNCKVTDVVPLICQKCNRHFCVKHRHIECKVGDEKTLPDERKRYAKPVQEFEIAKNAVDKQVAENLNKVKKKQKNGQLANQVQLMKIKNKATGLKTIPTTDRVYFNIQFPKCLGSKFFPVFVSKTWTVGRIIDAIASLCKIANNNNKASENKLRLFKKDTGEIITRNIADSLEVLMKTEVILDGENLIIEYVEDSCLQLDYILQ